MKTHQKTKRIFFVMAMLFCIFFLSGCRESMVIQQIIYDQASEDIDFQNELKVAKNINDSQNKDEELPDKKQDKADKKAEEKHQASKKGDKDNEGEASKVTPNPNVPDNGDSNSGTDGDKDSDREDPKGNKPGDSDKDDKTPSDDDSEAGPSDDPNDRQIYDGDGNVVDLPEEVNNVVAAGDAATIVQMLGGKSIIAGSSSSFTGNSLAGQVFAAEGVGKAETLWSGDGSSNMSTSNFNKLLGMKPDACVSISGQNSFSSSQLATLKSKKIAVVTLPSLNSYDNICEAVNVVGDMVGDRSGEDGGINAKNLASEYVSYCKNLVSEVQGKTGLFTWENKDFNKGTNTAHSTASNGQYTLYISGWENVSYSITNNSGSTLYQSNGVAIAPQGYANSPLSYFLSVAGTCNNGARFVRNAKAEYAIVPFNRNAFHHNISGSYSFYGDTNENFTRVKSSSLNIGLGEDQFKAIVVDSRTTKSKMQSSNTWKSYGRVTDTNGVTDYGFLADDGSMITSYIRGDYDIYVNPYGISSWANGSVESILETKWAAWKFHGAYSESEVKREIKKFYSKFYRYNLSDSQIDAILAGK